MIVAQPFIKWAGGKRQLLPVIVKNLPKELPQGSIDRFVEPFVGGGAVFFNLAQNYQFQRVVLSDFNRELVVTYKTIRDYPLILMDRLKVLQDTFFSKGLEDRKGMYYAARDDYNSLLVLDGGLDTEMEMRIATSFIFLNRLCFNGLYRVNSRGLFNVPFGDVKKPTICDEENIRAVSCILHNVEVYSGDFSVVEKEITQSSFVYLDPPYRPLNNSSSFNSYQKSPFNDEAQIRLANWYKKLDKMGSKLMLSNSDPKNSDPNDNFFDDLYKEYSIQRVQATRQINSKGNGRGHISEILITNY